MKSASVEDKASNPLYEADSLDLQAEKLGNDGKWDQARTLLQQSLDLRKEALGKTEPAIAFALDRLGEALLHCHRTAQADSAFAQSEEILESSYYSGHGYLAPVLEHHADSLTEEGKLAGAELVLKRALEIYTKTVTKENHATLRCIYKLALLYLKEEKAVDAQLILEKAMKQVDTPLGPCAEFRYQLAFAYILQAKFDEALKMLELSMSEFKQRHNFARVADCLDTCASLPETSAEKREVLKNQAKSFRERAFFYPSDIFLETLIRG